MGFLQSHILPELAAQKDRLFLWAPAMLGIGIGLYFSLRVEPPLVAGLMGLALTTALAVLVFPKRETSAATYGRWLAALFFFLVMLGFAAAQLRTMIVHTPMIPKPIKITEVTGNIFSIEEMEGNGGSRVLFSDLVIEKLGADKTPRLIRLRVRKDEGLEAGQRVKFLAGLNPPSPPVAPGAFDFQRYMYFDSIGAVGFVYNAPEIVEESEDNSLALYWERSREKLVRYIGASIPGREAALASALVTGKRKAIAESDLEALRDAGLAHLLAISGLHVGLVAGFLFFFSRLLMAAVPGLGLRYPIKKFSAVIAMAGALYYMMLVGAPVTTQRAMLMTGVVLLAVILDRWAISMRLVAFAAMVVLIIAPESLLSAGFHMSFAAVAALVAFYEHYRERLSVMYRNGGVARKVGMYFVGVSITTVIASTATAFFALYHFQQYAQYSLLGNFVAVPLMAFVVMPMAVLGLLLAPLNASGPPFYLMGKGIEGILSIADWVARLPGAVLHVTVWPLPALILFTSAALFLILWRGRGKALCLPLIIVLGIVIYKYKQPDILISSSFDLIGVTAESGTFYASNKNKERFVRESWERMLGLPEDGSEKWPREGTVDGLSCDAAGCLTTLKGKKIAFVFSPYAIPEDCAWADIVIAQEPVKKQDCAARYIIDRFDVWYGGAHGVWLSPDNVTIKYAEQFRGLRPWVQTPARAKSKTTNGKSGAD